MTPDPAHIDIDQLLYDAEQGWARATEARIPHDPTRGDAMTPDATTPDHLCSSNGNGRCVTCGADEPPQWPRISWVCDGCMARVVRSQIADMADGEHVLCKRCAR